MNRITEKQLQAVVDRLNRLTNNPLASHTRVLDAPLAGDVPNKQGDARPGRILANIGNYHLSWAYGGVCLHQMHNEGGGVTTPIGSGYNTKRELYEKMHAFISGIETQKGETK
jgi:hypothetical protein